MEDNGLDEIISLLEALHLSEYRQKFMGKNLFACIAKIR